MRNAHSNTWSMSRKPKMIENEKQILYDMKYCEKERKTLKKKNAHVGPGILREN